MTDAEKILQQLKNPYTDPHNAHIWDMAIIEAMQAIRNAIPAQPEQNINDRLFIPPLEGNDELRNILGIPCFKFIRLSKSLREIGYTIANKAEDEQAVCMHFLLTLLQKHGNDWANAGEDFLKQARAALKVE